MHVFYIDDSFQKTPKLPKMGPMVAVGGFVIEISRIKSLEQDLNHLCAKVGFPDGQMFKWSPGSGLWMKSNLIGNARADFQKQVIAALSKHGCRAVFVAEDKNCRPADKANTHEIDVLRLLVERAEWFFSKNRTEGTIILDRHGGDHREEESFLAHCYDTVRDGTTYVKPAHIAMTISSQPCRLSRLLQAADLVAGSTLAYVSGEDHYSPAIVEQIKPLLIRENERVGGVGVKLHPSFKYSNLYHWLFGDTHLWHGDVGIPLPWADRGYSKGLQKY
jgi:hypothetical protein